MGEPFMAYHFKLVAVKTITFSHDPETPKTKYTFEYGGLALEYRPQLPSGGYGPAVITGWNRVQNISLTQSGATSTDFTPVVPIFK